MDTETLFTVREAAARIGVTQSAIRNATLQGRLPFVVKFGRKLIERDALEAYQARTQPGGVKSCGRPYKTDRTAPAPAAESRGEAAGRSVVTGTGNPDADSTARAGRK